MTLTCPICNRAHTEVCIKCQKPCPYARVVDTMGIGSFAVGDFVYACMNAECTEFLAPKRKSDKQGVGLCPAHKKYGAVGVQALVNKGLMGH